MVEHHPSKVVVAGSSPVSRSIFSSLFQLPVLLSLEQCLFRVLPSLLLTFLLDNSSRIP